ncbi:zinc finger protein 436-like isoform X1 [Micropterus salmoides]|uniref:zinc finger protein 436-like isoform X1 n=1 Tax=Micropterus salmoides TaxID=27706 RepID=UPI0018EDA93A|nr:zinc finger protein 436-like isoform X1 [Micropterus salmoides]
MFQLRMFVHQRLYAAAEEILGEVEKTITSVFYEAGVVQRPKEGLGDRSQKLHQISATDAPLTNAGVTGEEVLQETSTQPLKQEESNLSTTEVPGTSQTTADTENGDGNCCYVQIDFKIKGEQEELGGDGQTQEIVLPSSEIVKSEQDQSDPQVFCEFQPVSSDCSAAQSGGDGSDEEWVQSKGAQVKAKRQTFLRRQNGRMKQGGQEVLPDGDSSAESEKGRSVCPICGKGFQYIRSFMKHIKTHKRIESMKELLNNLQRAHNRRLVCDVCGKMFSSPRGLQIHSRLHTGMKDFKCQDCEKTFNQKVHLIVHMRTHTGERPYRCGSCGTQFYTSGHLKKHIKRFSGEKPYSCDICDKRFCHRGQWIQHNNTVHIAGSME